MSTTTNVHRKLLKDYTRPIVHMRHQVGLKRFGLVFCAGLSKSFNLPDWPELVDRISKDSSVRGRPILERFTARGSLSYKTELLFQHFRKLQAEKYDGINIYSLEFENRTLAKWLRICAKHLYKDSRRSFKRMLEKHPYLLHLIPIIQETPLTVTYNFDDYLERALGGKKREDDNSRGFETVTNPWMQFRRPAGVVYHPNGIIPSILMELPRDRFVFSESSFAKQQIGVTGDISFLVNHFSKNTCLIVGSSLEDETLRTVLVQSAEINPGNCHYYVHFLPNGKKMPQEDMDAIRRANFNVFNLITLFLDNTGIAALAQLINPRAHFNNNVLSDLAQEEKIRLQYHYYLTGALGVGKSTIANQFRNLIVLDEWQKPRLKILAKPWDTLTKKEKMAAVRYIMKAIELLKKNGHEIRKRFGVRKIGIFGSYARGEEREGSDIDVLVDFQDNYETFDNFMDLKFFLEDLFSRKIDLVTIDALRPQLKNRILQDVKYA